MEFKATIERFKLYEGSIPPECMKELDKARRLHTPERVTEAIPIYKSVLEKYSGDLSRTSLAVVSYDLGFAYWVTDQFEEARASMLSIMEIPRLNEFFYGHAQCILAFLEAEHKRFDKARSILDDAEKRYFLEPPAYESARKMIDDKEAGREES